jgi:uncharacterized membrane protein YidH (DUF202 family)
MPPISRIQRFLVTKMNLMAINRFARYGSQMISRDPSPSAPTSPVLRVIYLVIVAWAVAGWARSCP